MCGGASTKTACKRGILCWAPLFGVTKHRVVRKFMSVPFQRRLTAQRREKLIIGLQIVCLRKSRIMVRGACRRDGLSQKKLNEVKGWLKQVWLCEDMKRTRVAYRKILPRVLRKALESGYPSCLLWAGHVTVLILVQRFFKGMLLNVKFYVLPAPDFYNGKIWKLKKTVYGLSDAARAWYVRVRHELLRLNMKTSSLDPALFFWKCDGKLAGIICLHVDDLFWSGIPKFQQDVIAHICTSRTRAFRRANYRQEATEPLGPTGCGCTTTGTARQHT